MAHLGLLNGRVEAAWMRIRPRLDLLPPQVARAVRAAGVATFQTFAAKRAPVFQAAEAGAPWPVTSAQWFADATAADRRDAQRGGRRERRSDPT